MSSKPPVKTYIAGFTYTAPDTDLGRFQLIVQETSVNRAEKAFRKKIRMWFNSRPELHPLRVFIQDIIEIEGSPEFSPVMFFQQKDRIEGNRHQVFFSPLPLREPHATSWALSMPEEPELFWDSEMP